VFTGTKHLSLREDARENTPAQVGFLDKGLAKVARPAIAKIPTVFAS
jgi:hypothetical protein